MTCQVGPFHLKLTQIKLEMNCICSIFVVGEKACSNCVGLVGEFREDTHTSTAVGAELYSIYFIARITLII